MRKMGWIIVCMCLCLSLPSVFHKSELETSSQQVEFVIDFSSLFTIDKQGRTDSEHVDYLLPMLKEEGIHSVSIPFNTFDELENRGLASFVTGEELLTDWVGLNEQNEVKHNGFYLFLIDNSIESDVDKWLLPLLERVQKSTINGQVVYEMTGYGESYLTNLRFPLLERDERKLAEHDLMMIPLIPNNSIATNVHLFQESIASWEAEGRLSKVMFDGKNVIGYPQLIEDWTTIYHPATVVYQETYASESRQNGILDVVKEVDYNAVRSHMLSGKSLLNTSYTIDVLEERVTKAVHERNNRMVHVELKKSPNANIPLQSWDKWSEVMKGVKSNLEAKGYTFGVSEPFTGEESVWVQISKGSFIVLSATLFALLLSLYIPIRFAWVGWVTALIGLIGAQLLVPSFLWSLLPFAFAVLYPVTIAGFLLKKWGTNQQGFLRSAGLFIGVSLLSVICALALTGIHASIPYVMYASFFKGVGLAHLLPLLIVSVMVFFDGERIRMSTFLSILKQPIRVIHIVLLGVVLIGAVFYVTRTGNSGMLLPFEAELRRFLQEAFGVRPRTKEFLIGHPLLLMVLFFLKTKPWMKWFLPLAIIGQLSILNTFAHLHTPVSVSLIRSLLGIGMGFVIGCILIGVSVWVQKQIQKRKGETISKK